MRWRPATGGAAVAVLMTCSPCEGCLPFPAHQRTCLRRHLTEKPFVATMRSERVPYPTPYPGLEDSPGVRGRGLLLYFPRFLLAARWSAPHNTAHSVADRTVFRWFLSGDGSRRILAPSEKT